MSAKNLNFVLFALHDILRRFPNKGEHDDGDKDDEDVGNEDEGPELGGGERDADGLGQEGA